jgi:colicin import membrane protein
VRSIRPNIIYPESIRENPAAVVEVRAGPDGSVLSRRLVQPSGNAAWDEAVLRAIDRTGRLPRDTDGRVPPRIEITFRPQD